MFVCVMLGPTDCLDIHNIAIVAECSIGDIALKWRLYVPLDYIMDSLRRCTHEHRKRQKSSKAFLHFFFIFFLNLLSLHIVIYVMYQHGDATHKDS